MNASHFDLETQDMAMLGPTLYAGNTGGGLPRLIGDKRRLLQVLISLVKNALAQTESGSIRISTLYEAFSSFLVIHVEDTGAGIAAD